MRAALWLLGLFGGAVAVALFVGNNQGVVTVFWPPYRIDLSFNLVVLSLAVLFFVLHVALRTLSALFQMPLKARRWRIQHQERLLQGLLLEAIANLLAGRFVRARKAAQAVLARESALARSGETLDYAAQLRAVSHLLAAEGAQAVQDKGSREEHFHQAVALVGDGQETREAVQLRAARWALEDHDALTALELLDALPQGAMRRTLALRLRLKAARQARQTLVALETARLLVKHRAFSEVTRSGILTSLALELVQTGRDPEQLQVIWDQLDDNEHRLPVVAIEAADKMVALGGSVALSRTWLLPVWERMLAYPGALTEQQRSTLVRVLERGFELLPGVADNQWLQRIEQAQLSHPGDAVLQYLAAMVCFHSQLWGKAQQLLSQSVPRLNDQNLKKNAWITLAQLAEQRGDQSAGAQAWKNAAKVNCNSAQVFN